MQYKRWFAAASIVLAVSAGAIAEGETGPTAPNMDSITLEDLKHDVHYLASDDMRGRETCHPEADMAAAYIRKRMQRAGVQPAGESNGWYQTVKLAHREWVEKPTVKYTTAGKETVLKYEQDFVGTDGPSTDAEIKDAQIVFAGYAINEKEREYNDVEGLDLKGKVAMILRYEPTPWSQQAQQEGDDQRRRRRRNRFSRSSFLQSKEALLREAGAVAILMVTGPESLGGNDNRPNLPSPEAAEKSPPLRLAGSTRGADDIPFLHLTVEAADALLGGEGALKRAQQAFDIADFTKRPDLSGMRVSVTAKSREIVRECRNVAGKIEGELDEWIVFGAHHDHLGVGWFGARDGAENRGQVYNGADDNATGVGCVLEIAEALAQSGVKPRRSFLFLTFTGEEKGLLGSRWYVRNPLVPNDKVVAMINIDMIGRIADKKMQLQGPHGSPLMERIAAESVVHFPTLQWSLSERPPLPASDHWAFYGEAGIPIVFPWGGSNELYHTAKDDPETINYEDMVPVVKMLYEFSWRLSNDSGWPGYKGPNRDKHREETAPPKPIEPKPAPPKDPPKPKEEEFVR
jgi:hypothetical protein